MPFLSPVSISSKVIICPFLTLFKIFCLTFALDNFFIVGSKSGKFSFTTLEISSTLILSTPPLSPFLSEGFINFAIF